VICEGNGKLKAVEFSRHFPLRRSSQQEIVIFHRKLKTIAFACVAFGAVSAHAGSLTFNSYADGSQSEQSEQAIDLQGQKNGSFEVDDGVAAGFNVTYTDGNGSSSTFTSYCIDLFGYVGFEFPTAAYTSGPASASTSLTAAQTEDIGKLYTVANASGDIGTQTQYAAFQLAIWEIVYEGSLTDPHSLATGDLTGTPGLPEPLDGIDQTLATQATLDLADTWLAALPAANDDYNVMVLNHGTSAVALGDGTFYDYQDQVYATPNAVTAPVPEPSTYALTLAGLAGVGFIARRKAAAKR
jgi:PEP-CTERM motif